ncbi:hotdog family protein [Pseudochryseolinea flava]|uniref:3-hydroxyacyl-ACP dehydratase n=1 Tax=Pseudochryseolinea flava TaxID=2059302 RepID=A0A364Y1K6_9BACT|nr:3-hydroxyacyl-ACP dehydratase [Pseudochryseolinea flava]RAW00153.1 3-hydroxyacyl-ACP dehydratase [Pseudochryseolinea flava]
MLRNKFYDAVPVMKDGEITATVTFQKDHPVFAGHFPGNPVVPGVCMIQIVRELLEDSLNMQLQLRTGDNIKFLNVINPIDTPAVVASIHTVVTDDGVEVQATFSQATVSYFKFKGSFVKL